MSIPVKVFVRDKERMVGAMIKALAFEIGRNSAVKGVSFPILEATSHYTFTFERESDANRFREAVPRYLPGYLAQVVEDSTGPEVTGKPGGVS